MLFFVKMDLDKFLVAAGIDKCYLLLEWDSGKFLARIASCYSKARCLFFVEMETSYGAVCGHRQMLFIVEMGFRQISCAHS